MPSSCICHSRARDHLLRLPPLYMVCLSPAWDAVCSPPSRVYILGPWQARFLGSFPSTTACQGLRRPPTPTFPKARCKPTPPWLTFRSTMICELPPFQWRSVDPALNPPQCEHHRREESDLPHSCGHHQPRDRGDPHARSDCHPRAARRRNPSGRTRIPGMERDALGGTPSGARNTRRPPRQARRAVRAAPHARGGQGPHQRVSPNALILSVLEPGEPRADPGIGLHLYL